MGALGTAAQIVMHRHSQRHEQAMMELRAGALGQLAEALYARRTDAVKSGFSEIMRTYADQAKGLISQQTDLNRAMIRERDALARVEMNTRLRDIDAELGRIRADALLLYGRMTEVLLLLNAPSFPLGADLAGALSLPIN
jgi:hypothetical protein